MQKDETSPKTNKKNEITESERRYYIFLIIFIPFILIPLCFAASVEKGIPNILLTALKTSLLFLGLCLVSLFIQTRKIYINTQERIKNLSQDKKEKLILILFFIFTLFYIIFIQEGGECLEYEYDPIHGRICVD